jgi:subtilisin family serine protease
MRVHTLTGSSIGAKMMRSSRMVFALLLLLCFSAQSLSAQTPPPTRLIVRTSLGLPGIRSLCKLLGCSTIEELGDPQGQLFMVQLPTPIGAGLSRLLSSLPFGIVDIETDQTVQTQGAAAGSAPSYLDDTAPYTYYGTTVWHGYVYQPGNELVRTDQTHAAFNVAGSGVTVAVIDTGVDPNNTVLQNSLVAGYDFTRNQSGGSEMNDWQQSSVPPPDNTTQAAQVSQSAVAVLDQSAVAVLDGNPQYAAFGHGTMTSGIVHLVAPQASIMPLKAFQSNGTGYDSDILRAIYYAVNNGAHVINMSFNYASYSQELANAINYATNNGLICVAAAGNSGEQATVYPAALKNVIDVASTSNDDAPSTFSNYGAPPVWLAAPGEGIMTTYPFNTYAAGWGTSFSTPFVSGTAALLTSMYSAQAGTNASASIGQVSLSVSSEATASAPSRQPQAANAVSNAQSIPYPQMGYGRLDTYQATQAWQTNLGLY